MWADANLDQLGEGVWWAGVETALVRLDVARDYSEEWIHHHQLLDVAELQTQALRTLDESQPVNCDAS